MSTMLMPSLQIDATHSNVEFSVKHLMIAKVRGRFGKVSGQVEYNDREPHHSVVTVSIDTTSIDTREERRDAHLRSADFFDVERHPTIEFRSTGISGKLDGVFQLTGDLTIRGTTRPITLEVAHEGKVRDPWGNLKSGYSARGKLKRSDFGLTWNQALETGGVVVGDEVAIAIELELVHPA